MDYKNLLNPPQYDAVTTKDGPVLILAGAGSGKTRVITYRISYLINECGVNPAEILAITFTNKAAREMLERTDSLVPNRSKGLWINTFHACCGKILRVFADLVGYTKSFIVYDDSEQKTIIKDALKELNLDPKQYPVPLIRAIISNAKDNMLLPGDFEKQIIPGDANQKRIAEVYKIYQRKLIQNNAMDFDDMILNTIILFKEFPHVLEQYQNRFKYIMVDEYQDTNKSQFEFVNLLASKYENLCVVGDDDQSIYSFRGADVSNILNFEKNYPNAKVIKLEENYRSTQTILDAANAVIKNNKYRKSKALWTSTKGGKKIKTFLASDQNEEAYFVSKTISDMVSTGNWEYKDFTILYRINALSQSLESNLRRRNIPYRVYGGLKFFDRKEIKDLISYLRLASNESDDLALKRIINEPARGIGKTTIERIEFTAQQQGISMYEVCARADEFTSDLGKAQSKLMSFANLIDDMRECTSGATVSEIVQFVVDNSGLVQAYKDENTDEAESRLQNLKEFVSVAKEFENDQLELEEGDASFDSFLQNIALSSDMDENADSDNCVSLMTMHNAKGLEFPVVFIVGAEDGIFPSAKSFSENNGIEEERRLCYVAITRAKKELYLTHTGSRMLYGQTTCSVPSRFIKEIPDELIEGGCKKPANKSYFGSSVHSMASAKKSTTKSNYNPFDSFVKKQTVDGPGPIGEDKHYEVGEKVFHKKYGNGTVAKIEGIGKDAKIDVLFDEFGNKRFMLVFADLQKI